MASETADNRQGRLRGLRRNQRERLAAEPVDERQARLRRLRTNQGDSTESHAKTCVYAQIDTNGALSGSPHNALHPLVIL